MSPRTLFGKDRLPVARASVDAAGPLSFLSGPAISQRATGLWLIVLTVAGVLIRLAWRERPTSLIEPEMIAVALVQGQGFSDALGAGTGPTAHVSPVIPIFLSLVYRAFGSASLASNTILSVISIGLVILSMRLAFLVMRELHVPTWANLCALATTALLPIQFNLEVVELRVWETPAALVAMLTALLLAIRLDTRRDLRWRDAAILIAPAAATALMSPPVMLVVLALLALVALRRLTRRDAVLVLSLAAATVTAVMLPWALRNERVMNRMIWTRSNAGLELALAYNDTILNGRDARTAYIDRMREIHPLFPSGKGREAMRAAGGELPYYDTMGREARRWIAEHPADAVKLFVRHIVQYIAPPTWFFQLWGHAQPVGVPLRALLITLSSIATLAGLPFLIRADARFWYVALTLVLIAAPYVVVQPILRYHYMASTLLIFTSFAAAALVAGWTASRLDRSARSGAILDPAVATRL